MKKIVVIHGDVRIENNKVFIHAFDGVDFWDLEVQEDAFLKSFTKPKYFEDGRNIYLDPEHAWISPIIERWAKIQNDVKFPETGDRTIAMVHEVHLGEEKVLLIAYGGHNFMTLQLEASDFHKSFNEEVFRSEGYNILIDSQRKLVCPMAERRVKVLNLGEEPQEEIKYDYHHDFA